MRGSLGREVGGDRNSSSTAREEGPERTLSAPTVRQALMHTNAFHGLK